MGISELNISNSSSLCFIDLFDLLNHSSNATQSLLPYNHRLFSDIVLYPTRPNPVFQYSESPHDSHITSACSSVHSGLISRLLHGLVGHITNDDDSYSHIRPNCLSRLTNLVWRQHECIGVYSKTPDSDTLNFTTSIYPPQRLQSVCALWQLPSQAYTCSPCVASDCLQPSDLIARRMALLFFILSDAALVTASESWRLYLMESVGNTEHNNVDRLVSAHQLYLPHSESFGSGGGPKTEPPYVGHMAQTPFREILSLVGRFVLIFYYYYFLGTRIIILGVIIVIFLESTHLNFNCFYTILRSE
ncbi:unnamed protein product [Protopolystoma xenopodis]|uniref:Uncharacterized protein n=1 Tax=Protopolystoma xenopodis TaxID=117903 RepID=A0A448WEG2_9PLAT|nr:unnamed protein product [Protopolystoma xenopodis]